MYIIWSVVLLSAALALSVLLCRAVCLLLGQNGPHPRSLHYVFPYDYCHVCGGTDKYLVTSNPRCNLLPVTWPRLHCVAFLLMDKRQPVLYVYCIEARVPACFCCLSREYTRVPVLLDVRFFVFLSLERSEQTIEIAEQ